MGKWARAPEPRDQAVLFARRLDDVLLPDHPVRLFDEILRRFDWGRFEACYHDNLGQPSIHPRVLASVLLYGMWFGLRGSRRLEESLLMRLDFRWLAEGQTIDHTTISGFRRRHPEELKDLFVQVCEVAREMGFLKLAQLGYDGTRVRSNNRRSGTRTREQLQRERDELAARFQEYQRLAEQEDARDEQQWRLQNPRELPAELRDAQRRLEKLDVALAKFQKLTETGGKAPTRVPITDPESRLMPNKDGGHAPNYTPTATVDLESGLVACDDVLSRINEDAQLIESYERVQQDFGLATPPSLAADGLMATGANIAACEERGIEFYSPVPLPDPAVNPALRADPSQPVAQTDWDRLPTHPLKLGKETYQQLDKTAFVYDEARDCYWCPMGQSLDRRMTTSEVTAVGRRIRARYVADAGQCSACPLRPRCVMSKAKSRQINREQYDAHRDRHTRHMATPEAKEKYALRRHAGERPFAVIKHQFGLRQFLLRGLKAVRIEWRWAVASFNLQRMISLLRCRAGPAPALPRLTPSPQPS